MDGQITNDLCEARMGQIKLGIDNITKKIDAIDGKLGDLTELCQAIPDHEKRIKAVEDWKSNLSFTKLITTVSGCVAGILIVLEFVKKLLNQ